MNSFTNSDQADFDRLAASTDNVGRGVGALDNDLRRTNQMIQDGFSSQSGILSRIRDGVSSFGSTIGNTIRTAYENNKADYGVNLNEMRNQTAAMGGGPIAAIINDAMQNAGINIGGIIKNSIGNVMNMFHGHSDTFGKMDGDLNQLSHLQQTDNDLTNQISRKLDNIEGLEKHNTDLNRQNLQSNQGQIDTLKQFNDKQLAADNKIDNEIRQNRIANDVGTNRIIHAIGNASDKQIKSDNRIATETRQGKLSNDVNNNRLIHALDANIDKLLRSNSMGRQDQYESNKKIANAILRSGRGTNFNSTPSGISEQLLAQIAQNQNAPFNDSQAKKPGGAITGLVKEIAGDVIGFKYWFSGRYEKDIHRSQNPLETMVDALLKIYEWERIGIDLSRRQLNEIIKATGGVPQKYIGHESAVRTFLKNKAAALHEGIDKKFGNGIIGKIAHGGLKLTEFFTGFGDEDWKDQRYAEQQIKFNSWAGDRNAQYVRKHLNNGKRIRDFYGVQAGADLENREIKRLETEELAKYAKRNRRNLADFKNDPELQAAIQEFNDINVLSSEDADKGIKQLRKEAYKRLQTKINKLASEYDLANQFGSGMDQDWYLGSNFDKLKNVEHGKAFSINDIIKDRNQFEVEEENDDGSTSKKTYKSETEQELYDTIRAARKATDKNEYDRLKDKAIELSKKRIEEIKIETDTAGKFSRRGDTLIPVEIVSANKEYYQGYADNVVSEFVKAFEDSKGIPSGLTDEQREQQERDRELAEAASDGTDMHGRQTIEAQGVEEQRRLNEMMREFLSHDFNPQNPESSDGLFGFLASTAGGIGSAITRLISTIAPLAGLVAPFAAAIYLIQKWFGDNDGKKDASGKPKKYQSAWDYFKEQTGTAVALPTSIIAPKLASVPMAMNARSRAKDVNNQEERAILEGGGALAAWIPGVNYLATPIGAWGTALSDYVENETGSSAAGNAVAGTISRTAYPLAARGTGAAIGKLTDATINLTGKALQHGALAATKLGTTVGNSKLVGKMFDAGSKLTSVGSNVAKFAKVAGIGAQAVIGGADSVLRYKEGDYTGAAIAGGGAAGGILCACAGAGPAGWIVGGITIAALYFNDKEKEKVIENANLCFVDSVFLSNKENYDYVEKIMKDPELKDLEKLEKVSEYYSRNSIGGIGDRKYREIQLQKAEEDKEFQELYKTVLDDIEKNAIKSGARNDQAKGMRDLASIRMHEEYIDAKKKEEYFEKDKQKVSKYLKDETFVRAYPEVVQIVQDMNDGKIDVIKAVRYILQFIDLYESAKFAQDFKPAGMSAEDANERLGTQYDIALASVDPEGNPYLAKDSKEAGLYSEVKAVGRSGISFDGENYDVLEEDQLGKLGSKFLGRNLDIFRERLSNADKREKLEKESEVYSRPIEELLEKVKNLNGNLDFLSEAELKKYKEYLASQEKSPNKNNITHNPNGTITISLGSSIPASETPIQYGPTIEALRELEKESKTPSGNELFRDLSQSPDIEKHATAEPITETVTGVTESGKVVQIGEAGPEALLSGAKSSANSEVIRSVVIEAIKNNPQALEQLGFTSDESKDNIQYLLSNLTKVVESGLAENVEEAAKLYNWEINNGQLVGKELKKIDKTTDGISETFDDVAKKQLEKEKREKAEKIKNKVAASNTKDIVEKAREFEDDQGFFSNIIGSLTDSAMLKFSSVGTEMTQEVRDILTGEKGQKDPELKKDIIEELKEQFGENIDESKLTDDQILTYLKSTKNSYLKEGIKLKKESRIQDLTSWDENKEKRWRNAMSGSLLSQDEVDEQYIRDISNYAQAIPKSNLDSISKIWEDDWRSSNPTNVADENAYKKYIHDKYIGQYQTAYGVSSKASEQAFDIMWNRVVRGKKPFGNFNKLLPDADIARQKELELESIRSSQDAELDKALKKAFDEKDRAEAAKQKSPVGTVEDLFGDQKKDETGQMDSAKESLLKQAESTHRLWTLGDQENDEFRKDLAFAELNGIDLGGYIKNSYDVFNTNVDSEGKIHANNTLSLLQSKNLEQLRQQRLQQEQAEGTQKSSSLYELEAAQKSHNTIRDELEQKLKANNDYYDQYKAEGLAKLQAEIDKYNQKLQEYNPFNDSPISETAEQMFERMGAFGFSEHRLGSATWDLNDFKRNHTRYSDNVDDLLKEDSFHNHNLTRDFGLGTVKEFQESHQKLEKAQFNHELESRMPEPELAVNYFKNKVYNSAKDIMDDDRLSRQTKDLMLRAHISDKYNLPITIETGIKDYDGNMQYATLISGYELYKLGDEILKKPWLAYDISQVEQCVQESEEVSAEEFKKHVNKNIKKNYKKESKKIKKNKEEKKAQEEKSKNSEEPAELTKESVKKSIKDSKSSAKNPTQTAEEVKELKSSENKPSETESSSSKKPFSWDQKFQESADNFEQWLKYNQHGDTWNWKSIGTTLTDHNIANLQKFHVTRHGRSPHDSVTGNQYDLALQFKEWQKNKKTPEDILKENSDFPEVASEYSDFIERSDYSQLYDKYHSKNEQEINSLSPEDKKEYEKYKELREKWHVDGSDLEYTVGLNGINPLNPEIDTHLEQLINMYNRGGTRNFGPLFRTQTKEGADYSDVHNQFLKFTQQHYDQDYNLDEINALKEKYKEYSKQLAHPELFETGFRFVESLVDRDLAKEFGSLGTSTFIHDPSSSFFEKDDNPKRYQRMMELREKYTKIKDDLDHHNQLQTEYNNNRPRKEDTYSLDDVTSTFSGYNGQMPELIQEFVNLHPEYQNLVGQFTSNNRTKTASIKSKKSSKIKPLVGNADQNNLKKEKKPKAKATSNKKASDSVAKPEVTHSENPPIENLNNIASSIQGITPIDLNSTSILNNVPNIVSQTLPQNAPSLTDSIPIPQELDNIPQATSLLPPPPVESTNVSQDTPSSKAVPSPQEPVNAFEEQLRNAAKSKGVDFSKPGVYKWTPGDKRVLDITGTKESDRYKDLVHKLNPTAQSTQTSPANPPQTPQKTAAQIKLARIKKSAEALKSTTGGKTKGALKPKDIPAEEKPNEPITDKVPQPAEVIEDTSGQNNTIVKKCNELYKQFVIDCAKNGLGHPNQSSGIFDNYLEATDPEAYKIWKSAPYNYEELEKIDRLYWPTFWDTYEKQKENKSGKLSAQDTLRLNSKLGAIPSELLDLNAQISKKNAEDITPQQLAHDVNMERLGDRNGKDTYSSHMSYSGASKNFNEIYQEAAKKGYSLIQLKQLDESNDAWKAFYQARSDYETKQAQENPEYQKELANKYLRTKEEYKEKPGKWRWLFDPAENWKEYYKSSGIKPEEDERYQTSKKSTENAEALVKSIYGDNIPDVSQIQESKDVKEFANGGFFSDLFNMSTLSNVDEVGRKLIVDHVKRIGLNEFKKVNGYISDFLEKYPIQNIPDGVNISNGDTLIAADTDIEELLRGKKFTKQERENIYKQHYNASKIEQNEARLSAKFAEGGIINTAKNLFSSNGINTNNELVEILSNHIIEHGIENFKKYLTGGQSKGQTVSALRYISEICPIDPRKLPEGFKDEDLNLDTIEALDNIMDAKVYGQEKGLGYVDRLRQRSRYADIENYASSSNGSHWISHPIGSLIDKIAGREKLGFSDGGYEGFSDKPILEKNLDGSSTLSSEAGMEAKIKFDDGGSAFIPMNAQHTTMMEGLQKYIAEGIANNGVVPGDKSYKSGTTYSTDSDSESMKRKLANDLLAGIRGEFADGGVQDYPVQEPINSTLSAKQQTMNNISFEQLNTTEHEQSRTQEIKDELQKTAIAMANNTSAVIHKTSTGGTVNNITNINNDPDYTYLVAEGSPAYMRA